MNTQKCHARVIMGIVGCTALVLAVSGASAAQAHGRDVARRTLPA
ncbi:pectate lyase, partial [Streptomyces sp. SID14478]|nr:pectate lyase [Streptomyces sp. SID14478]